MVQSFPSLDCLCDIRWKGALAHCWLKTGHRSAALLWSTKVQPNKHWLYFSFKDILLGITLEKETLHLVCLSISAQYQCQLLITLLAGTFVSCLTYYLMNHSHKMCWTSDCFSTRICTNECNCMCLTPHNIIYLVQLHCSKELCTWNVTVWTSQG